MDFIVRNTINVDIHPFSCHINEKTKFLIVGTMPPHRFCNPHEVKNNGDIDWFLWK